ncbi:MAG: hypothetical protein FJY67_11255, partial [Calditrichaeota bacterium]|nr:hypothetical protein [Calditrichota bacterium]
MIVEILWREFAMMTLGEAAERFLAGQQVAGRPPSALETVRRDILIWVAFLGENRKCDLLRQEDIIRFLQ